MTGLIWSRRPELRQGPPRPVLVAAFEGWNDAAEAASGAVAWLRHRFDATRFARLDAEAYVDFQSTRPTIEIRDGVVRDLTWPSIDFWAARPIGGARDLVLVSGTEPNVHWKAFCDDILTVARETGCEMVVTLGALLSDTPHTRPLQITGVAVDQGLVGHLNLERSQYEGPTGIVGVLLDACFRAEMPTVSLWAPVPHYVASPPNPKAIMALLSRVHAVTGVDCGTSGLKDAVAAWEERVSQAVAEDAETAEYVRRLEERVDATDVLDDDDLRIDEDDDLDDELSEEDVPTGDDLAAELERFLREQDDE
jgi:proteasome assembly chaperone (PAC2) family protein